MFVHLAGRRALKEAERKTPGFQRLRMAQYDGLRKKLISSHGTRALKGGVRAPHYGTQTHAATQLNASSVQT